ncbi:MAG: preprotein translocase subunit SecE [Candidatus Paceibacterota bacterium]|jgi:preprotein translocase subunit SecE
MTTTIEKMKVFWQESRQELRRVNWPTKQETIRYTLFVVVFSVSVSLYLGILDFAFVQTLEKIILK